MLELLLAKYGTWLLGVVAAIIAVLGYGARQKVKGHIEARRKQQIEDYENAEDIRNRVSRDRARRLRELDDAGYRD